MFHTYTTKCKVLYEVTKKNTCTVCSYLYFMPFNQCTSKLLSSLALDGFTSASLYCSLHRSPPSTSQSSFELRFPANCDSSTAVLVNKTQLFLSRNSLILRSSTRESHQDKWRGSTLISGTSCSNE